MSVWCTGVSLRDWLIFACFKSRHLQRGQGWKESPPPPQNISLQYKHWAQTEGQKEREKRWREDRKELPVCEREREGFGETAEGWQRDRSPWKRPCLQGEAWDHCPVLLCTIIPLNPALLLSLPPIIPTHTHTLTLTPSSNSSVYWWLKLAVSFRIHSQHWSSGTSGPNGLISTVYSCALF